MHGNDDIFEGQGYALQEIDGELHGVEPETSWGSSDESDEEIASFKR